MKPERDRLERVSQREALKPGQGTQTDAIAGKT